MYNSETAIVKYIEEYLSHFSYKDDGSLFNKEGKKVGSYTKKYGRLCTPHGELSVPRVLIYLSTGSWPEEVDHIDGDTHNDSIDNLRPCKRKENAKNRRVYKNSKTGCKGVYKSGDRFLSQIQVDGKRIHLGRFESIKEAADAYDSAAIKHHGDFASLNNYK